MEKIKLTQEQFLRIGFLTSNYSNSAIMKRHYEGWKDVNECLNNLSYEQMDRILGEVDSYEVEEPVSKWKAEAKSITIEEYNRQEGINAIKQLVTVIGEKVNKNMQANINPKIKVNGEFTDETWKKIHESCVFANLQGNGEYTSEVFDSTMPVYSKKEQEHLNNPFYKKVDEITGKVALQQILKGAEKYPEPFNPASWTGEQLVNHGLQEARDLQVYLVGLAEHIERIEAEKFQLQDQLETEVKRVAELRQMVNEEREDKGKWYNEAQRWMKENESLKEEKTKIKEERDAWKSDCKTLERQLRQANDELKATCEARDHWKKAFYDCEKDFQELKELRN